MIRDHAMMRLAGAVGVGIGRIGACDDQVAHQVGGIVVVGALQQRGNPFDPHACVDGLVR